MVLAVICWAPRAQRRCYPTGRCTYRPLVTFLIVKKKTSVWRARAGARALARARARALSLSLSLSLSRFLSHSLSSSRAHIRTQTHSRIHLYKKVSACTSTQVYISVKCACNSTQVCIRACVCAFEPACVYVRPRVREHTHSTARNITDGRTDGRTDG